MTRSSAQDSELFPRFGQDENTSLKIEVSFIHFVLLKRTIIIGNHRCDVVLK